MTEKTRGVQWMSAWIVVSCLMVAGTPSAGRCKGGGATLFGRDYGSGGTGVVIAQVPTVGFSFPGRRLARTLRGRTITGYSEQEGWRRKNAARRWLHSGSISTFEEALAKVKAGLSFDRIPPVLIAQSMHALPHKYGTRAVVEVTEGRYRGTKIPGIILDCGDFGAHHYDIHTNRTDTAYALTSHRAKIHIMR